MSNRLTIEAALELLERFPWLYLHPIPTRDGKRVKSPPLTGWKNLSSNKPDEIRAMYQEHPGCNFAIDPIKSKVIPVDVDIRNGKVGLRTLATLEAKHGPFPETFRTLSPTKGPHFWLRATITTPYKQALGEDGFGPDVDVPPYVLIPGCVVDPIPEKDYPGGTYEEDVMSLGIVVDIPDWAAWYLQSRERFAVEQTPVITLDMDSEIARAVEYLVNDAPPCIEGELGNKTLYDVACKLKDFGISQEQACELINDYYNVLERSSGKPGCVPTWEYGNSEADNANRLEFYVGNAYTYAREKAPGENSSEYQFRDEALPTDEEIDQIVNSPEQQRINRVFGRRRIKIFKARLAEAVENSHDVLAADVAAGKPDPLFVRDHKLVRLSRNLVEIDGAKSDKYERGALVIVQVTEAWLTLRLDRAAIYVGAARGNPKKQKDADKDKQEQRKLEVKDVPPLVVKTVLADETGWLVPTLVGTVECPTLRADGTVLDTPGFDEASGLYYDPAGVVFADVPDKPTQADGRTALGELDKLLVDFPFSDREGYEGVSRAAALAMLLTAIVRRSLPTAPFFGTTAPDVEAGKTLLSQVASIISSGREAKVKPWPNEPAEQRKAMVAYLAAGAPMLVFDNVEQPITGEFIASVATSGETEDRKLGVSETITAPTNTTIVFNGCHLVVAADMTSRVMMMSLQPDKALRERVFEYPDLKAYVLANRARLVVAALTALRAFIVAGRPGASKRSTLRFKEWDALVPAALVWYGYADATRAGDEIREIDPVRLARRRVIDAVRVAIANAELQLTIRGDAFSGTVSAAELLHYQLEDGVTNEIADAMHKHPKAILARHVSEHLKTLIDVSAADWILKGRIDANSVWQWWLVGPDLKRDLYRWHDGLLRLSPPPKHPPTRTDDFADG